MGIGEIGLCLELVRGIQQHGAQVAGVFEVVRLQLKMAAMCVRDDAEVVRGSSRGSVLSWLLHELIVRIYFNAHNKL